jgi:hypothetical protein
MAIRKTGATKNVNWMVHLGIITHAALAAPATSLLSGTAIVAATIPNNADTAVAASARATRSLLHTTK